MSREKGTIEYVIAAFLAGLVIGGWIVIEIIEGATK